MLKFNYFDLVNGKEDCNVILTDSLWIINERDKSGKHSNFYHGNFIPQTPNQLIRRYTKKLDYVLDLFLGSAKTSIECEKLERNIIGVDIKKELIDFIVIIYYKIVYNLYINLIFKLFLYTTFINIKK